MFLAYRQAVQDPDTPTSRCTSICVRARRGRENHTSIGPVLRTPHSAARYSVPPSLPPSEEGYPLEVLLLSRLNDRIGGGPTKYHRRYDDPNRNQTLRFCFLLGTVSAAGEVSPIARDSYGDLTGTGFRSLLTLFSKSFSTFLHSTCLLSVTYYVFSLGWNIPPA